LGKIKKKLDKIISKIIKWKNDEGQKEIINNKKL